MKKRPLINKTARNLRADEWMTQGQRGQTSRGGASYFSQEDYGGFCTQTPLDAKRILKIKYKTLGAKKNTLIFIFSEMCPIVQTDVHFLTLEICNLFTFGTDLLVRRQINIIFLLCRWVCMMSHQWKQKWNCPIILDKWNSSKKASLSEL